MRNNVCCIFNLAPHYRDPIYTLMDEELLCDFYFGDKVDTPIKLMNVSKLRGYKKTVKNKHILKTGFLWLTGTWKLVFKPYKYYILTGDPYILSNYLIAFFGRILNKKVYVWSHGMRGGHSANQKILFKFFFSICHKVLLYGEHAKDYMLSEGFNEDKLIPIYNSLNYNKQLKIREKLTASVIYSEHFKNNNSVLIYIGRIQKNKKLDLLIDSMIILKNNGIKCNLVIIGQDIENTGLESKVKKLQLENQVWFYGSCYDETQIGKLIFNADLCVSPGPIGLTAIHAMTYGTPIITNDNYTKQMPEFEVVIKNKTGDFFKEGDLTDLTSKISKWINLNPEKRKEIRNNAYSIIDNKYNTNYQIKVLKELVNIN
ncbi:MAG: glycosyltransferase [Cellulophaga sp.]